MAKCRFVKICPFYNGRMTSLAHLAEQFKQTYCTGNNFRCARYLLAMSLGHNNVPEDLYPNQMPRAEKIMEEKDKK